MSSAVDLHIHTLASDGTDSPAEILEKLLVKGIRTIAVCDHDTAAGSLEMQSLVPPEIRFIRGIEFSCRADQGKCHILGYNFDLTDEVFREALALARERRMKNLVQRLEFLASEFKITLTEAEADWIMNHPSPAKPHLGQILVARGLAEDVDEAIKKFINPCKTGDDRIPADMAVKAIAHAGGIPIWAHPLGGEGEKRVSQDDFGDRLEELMGYGIRGLECCYSRYSQKDVDFLLEQAAANGLLVSGGSDYHGHNKKGIALGQLNEADTPVDEKLLTVLDAL